jgi:S-adenosylmethionine synthetase
MILIESYQGQAIEEQPVEIVERKGLGHPDSICDAVAEAVSVALCREYLERCGRILHHNIDKSLLVAGQVDLGFGGGRVVQPMELIIGDRATDRWKDQKIPVADIARQAIQTWFRRHLPRIDTERHLQVRSVLSPGSAELTDLFARPGKVPGANDTSAGVGYWPLSSTENLVLKLDRFLTSSEFKIRHPECGEDIKIMALRQDRHLDLTLAMPLVAEWVTSEKDYFQRKQQLQAEMESFLDVFQVNYTLHFNALDMLGRGLDGVYLALLGTSAESADSGQVGRGNRISGLIPLNRPIGTEAAAGKNPISHVGKIYSVLAQQAARQLQEQIAEVREATVWFLSRIGQPIDRPVMANAQLILEKGCSLEDVESRARDILELSLSNILDLCNRLSKGELNLY